MARVHLRRPRRLRREALVFQHLERVSRDLLEDHPDIVRQFIGRNAGVYALYHKNRLYYVGLAKGLRSRLTAHGRNRHGKRWDHFSVYLTIRDQHLREIEALLLRITQPKGAKQSGKLAQSKDMKRQIMRAIRVKQRRQVTSLFAKYAIDKDRADDDGVESDLMHYLPNGARLRGSYKGKIYKARARRNGTIRYKGRDFSSLSHAAFAIVKRHVNGWWFWQVERGRGNWTRLTQIRKTGTPFYGR
jgi:Restriction Enzyme Adenine Methylase Associated/Protein of unknown function (DUF2924)